MHREPGIYKHRSPERLLPETKVEISLEEKGANGNFLHQIIPLGLYSKVSQPVGHNPKLGLRNVSRSHLGGPGEGCRQSPSHNHLAVVASVPQD